MNNALQEHALTLLKKVNYLELTGPDDEEEAIIRLTELQPRLIEFLDSSLKKSGRVKFTFKELTYAYDGPFGELLLEILQVGEAQREAAWTIEDVIWAGCEMLAERDEVGLHVHEELDGPDDFEYKHLL